MGGWNNFSRTISSEFEIEDPSCYDENDGQVLINNTSGGMAPYVYSLDGDNFSTSDQFNGLVAGVYDLYIQDSNGCEWSQGIELINPNEVQVDLGDELLVQLGDRFQLDPIINIPLSEVDTFIWNAITIEEFNPWLEPTESTIYSLKIINENGCEGEDEVKVLVKKDRLVYLPNIFTPNNDGVNDFFLPKFGKGVQKVNTFQVFDRWGELIFEKANFEPDDISAAWDGRLRGEALNNGVFVYFLELEFIDGRKEIYSGDVTLMK